MRPRLLPHGRRPLSLFKTNNVSNAAQPESDCVQKRPLHTPNGPLLRVRRLAEIFQVTDQGGL